MEVIEISPTCGIWATLAQRLADTVAFADGVDSSGWRFRVLSVILAPLTMAGYALDRVLPSRGDPLDHVLVARRPDVVP